MMMVLALAVPDTEEANELIVDPTLPLRPDGVVISPAADAGATQGGGE